MLKITGEAKSARKAYGSTLVELGRENKNIVVLDADLSCSTQTCMFAKEFPERFFNVGIAEQDLIGTAAGLALSGKTAFLSTFAMFATARCLDQIRNTVCYQKLNVKIIATHAGVTVGEDGASHQALEDISYMRSIPNMTVLSPSDCNEIAEVIRYAANTEGPFYVRIPRADMFPIFGDDYKFNPKNALKLQEGEDITLITNGETLIETLKCADLLLKDGIEADILHIPVIKPLCGKDDIIKSAGKTKKVVVIENHSIIGGLGSAICELLSENCPTPVKRIGTNDIFGQSGEQRVLLEAYGLTSNKLYEQIKGFLN